MSLPESALIDAATPYVSADEHLADVLARHDLLLKRRLARLQPKAAADLFGFASINDEEVQRLLDRDSGGESLPDVPLIEWRIEQIERSIDARVEQSLIAGLELPLVELARRFGLSRAEIDLLVPCVAVELDRRYERVYGFLHDDMSRRLMSMGLAIELSRGSFADRLRLRALLDANAPLRYYRLLDVVADATSTISWHARAVRADERIVSYIAGDRGTDSRIARFVTWLGGGEPGKVRAVSASTEREDAIARLVNAVRVHATDATKALAYLNGPKHSGADALVTAAARRIGERVMVVDMETLIEAAADIDGVLFLAFREALLEPSAVYLKNLDRVLESPDGVHRHRTLLRAIEDMGQIVFASGEHRWSWAVPPEPIALRVIPVQVDGVAAQLEAWRVAAGNRFTDGELHHLVSLHPTPAPAIASVWRMAKASAVADDGLPSFAEVQAACRQFAGAPVNTLARRLEPKHRLSDLVLPRAQLDHLEAICSQAKHSSVVYGAWRFDKKQSLGRGLNAMFTGQPGTGKTMAAEVIAAELGVEILKIDLSQIVSKYIGETEKNLRELFEQAARANAILFFDEADALLGKRSDVKDAHDRYANTETAYLLQKMEEYPGITILATNLRQNMDAAFTRRMRFIVDFPFPEEADRLRIWQSVWPAEVPLGPDVDCALLARQFRLAGGSIRNVAIAAAFLAAEEEQAVSMRHLMLATKRELQKMGRLVNEEEHRRYG